MPAARFSHQGFKKKFVVSEARDEPPAQKV
jgi:hypothetical protein